MLAAVAVGATGAALLFGAMPGINWLLCTALAAALQLALTGRRAQHEADSSVRAALAFAALLAGAAAVTASGVLHFFLWLGIVALFAAATVVNAGTRVDRLGPAGLAATPFRAAALIAREAAQRIDSDARGLLREDRNFRAFRGIALALPIVAAFFMLLGAADPTLAAWRDSIGRMFQDFDALPRLAFFVLLTGATLGTFGIAIRSRAPLAEDLPHPRASFTDIERTIVLGSVAVLFALFLVLQIPHLFGNPGSRVGSGMTLAEAVHRGFGELTIVVTLCTWVIIASDRYAIRGRRERLVRGLGLVLVAECLLLLASAWHRLAAYEAAYGYTSLRLYVAFYIAAAALALLLLAREVASTINLARLTRGIALIAITALSTLTYWNSAAWIVRQNVARFESTGQIDLGYLAWGMSDDALPAIAHLIPRLAPSEAATLSEQLRTRYAHFESTSATAAWYEWNLRRNAARRALQAIPLARSTDNVHRDGSPAPRVLAADG